MGVTRTLFKKYFTNITAKNIIAYPFTAYPCMHYIHSDTQHHFHMTCICQCVAWWVISIAGLRLRSAKLLRVGSGGGLCRFWLVREPLSRDWTMAWRRQVIHCCLLKESLACRLWDWALARPLLLTRKQFLTVCERWRKLQTWKWKVAFGRLRCTIPWPTGIVLYCSDTAYLLAVKP